jgi:hypothetical protein
VDELDHRQLVVLGVAVVGCEAQGIKTVLEQIVSALRDHPIAEFIDYQIEV